MCKRQFTVRIGTVMEDSPIGLEKWLQAIWMLVERGDWVSTYELAERLSLSQKSAWKLEHRIQLALNSDAVPLGDNADRYSEIMRAVLNTTLNQVRMRDQAMSVLFRAKGYKRTGPKPGTIPKHRLK